MPKVSIIIPVYNVEDYIKECLDSIVNQTLKDIEVILVDDGSIDNSGKICDYYAKQDKRIIVVHKENGGQSSARNKGLELAKGEFVIFIDSDDYITLDGLMILYNTAVENNVDIVHMDLLNDKDKLNDSGFRRINSENKVINTLQFLKEKVESKSYDIALVMYFIKRDLLNTMHFEAGYFYEDQLWTLQLLTKVKSNIIKIRYPFYFYRMNRTSSTTNYICLKNGKDSVHICNEIAMYIKKWNLELDYKKYLGTIMMISYYQFINVFLRLNNKDRIVVIKNLDKGVAEIALKNNEYYTKLYNTCYRFSKNPFLISFIYDMRMILRRFLKGI